MADNYAVGGAAAQWLGRDRQRGLRGDSMRSFVGRLPAGGETTAEVAGKGKIGRKAVFDRRAASRTIGGRRG